MDEDAGELIELYRARGAAEAHALRAELEDSGVRAEVDGEMLQGVVGEVPGGWVTAPRVLVFRDARDAAQAVLTEFLSRADPTSAGGGADPCLACKAPMGEAIACPACGWSFVAGSMTSPVPDLERNRRRPVGNEDREGTSRPGSGFGVMKVAIGAALGLYAVPATAREMPEIIAQLDDPTKGAAYVAGRLAIIGVLMVTIMWLIVSGVRSLTKPQ